MIDADKYSPNFYYTKDDQAFKAACGSAGGISQSLGWKSDGDPMSSIQVSADTRMLSFSGAAILIMLKVK